MAYSRSDDRHPDVKALRIASEAVDKHLGAALREKAAETEHPDATYVAYMDLASQVARERAGESFRDLMKNVGGRPGYVKTIAEILGLARQGIQRRYAER